MVYVYECRDCKHTFEAVQALSDDPLTECPKCSMLTLYRVIQPSPIEFKGPDWETNE